MRLLLFEGDMMTYNINMHQIKIKLVNQHVMPNTRYI